jgi:cytochrome c biogenesis factor
MNKTNLFHSFFIRSSISFAGIKSSIIGLTAFMNVILLPASVLFSVKNLTTKTDHFCPRNDATINNANALNFLNI